MPEIAVSPVSPTFTVTVVFAPKVVEPSTVAVTRAVFGPPFSNTPFCTLASVVSVSTESLIAVGVASSSVIVPVASPAVSETVALVEVIWTINVSSGSSITSSVVLTATVAVVDPAAMVTSAAATAV